MHLAFSIAVTVIFSGFYELGYNKVEFLFKSKLIPQMLLIENLSFM